MKMFRTSLKSTTAIVFSTLTIAAAALLFALGPTLGNQQALALVYGYLRNSTNQIFELKWTMQEFEEALAQKTGEMAYLNRECRKLRQRFIDYNTHNLHPITHSESDTNSHSTQIVPYNKE